MLAVARRLERERRRGRGDMPALDDGDEHARAAAGALDLRKVDCLQEPDEVARIAREMRATVAFVDIGGNRELPMVVQTLMHLLRHHHDAKEKDDDDDDDDEAAFATLRTLVVKSEALWASACNFLRQRHREQQQQQPPPQEEPPPPEPAAPGTQGLVRSERAKLLKRRKQRELREQRQWLAEVFGECERWWGELVAWHLRQQRERLRATSEFAHRAAAFRYTGAKTWAEVNADGAATKHPLKYPVRLTHDGTASPRARARRLGLSFACWRRGGGARQARTCAGTTTSACASRATRAPSTTATATSAAARATAPRSAPRPSPDPAARTSTRCLPDAAVGRAIDAAHVLRPWNRCRCSALRGGGVWASMSASTPCACEGMHPCDAVPYHIGPSTL
eukprot:scaffold2010_cov301-Prasinococcus_capsulatus_cf.AAC.12